MLYGKDRIEPKDNYIGMNFSRALEMLQLGHHLTRLGWNGMGQFVVYQKGYPEGINCNKQTAEAWGSPVPSDPAGKRKPCHVGTLYHRFAGH